MKNRTTPSSHLEAAPSYSADRYPPSRRFSASAHVSSAAEADALYEQSISDPEAFWEEAARELHWSVLWRQVLDWQEPWARWFVDGKLNASFNCVDRHALGGRAEKAAIVWEGESGEVRVLSYFDLYVEVQKFANVLKALHVHKGDRVAIYMGMVPEAVIAMLACCRIGAVHSVVFGGFAATALAERINDAGCGLLITQDAAFRRGKEVRLKEVADAALEHTPSIRSVVVYKHSGTPISFLEGRDHWWHKLAESVSTECPAEPMDAEDPLFLLYTSGTTGKPKGLVHTTGGYCVQTKQSSQLVFDLKEEDVYWCTADVGWITGHSYVVYGILLNGATTVLYEGAPDFPSPSRFWSIIDRHQVSIFYTSPTAIRAFMKWGEHYPRAHSLKSLRLLGSVGEPINPEAWLWFHDVVGGGRCPIVDTWWQTETGAIMIAPIPGVTATKPGSAALPLPGIYAAVLNADGSSVCPGEDGFLVIRRPWPAMARTIYGDPERFHRYWNAYPGSYFTGDGARQDEDGYFWILGRVDDVMNVSGHRLSTAEIEAALLSHPAVAEAAVVAKPDPMRGQAIVAFITTHSHIPQSSGVTEELKFWVAKEVGAFARPEEVISLERLPKTRSGKIMRRLLRELATTGKVEGDVTALDELA